jgi:lipoate-protein ligase A
MTWRLIDSDLVPPARSAAVDEALLLSKHRRQGANILHLYRRDRPTVSLGHFENVHDRVDLDAVGEHRVDIVRRMSGGSAIYTDPGQLVCSAVVDRELMPGSPADAFRLFCQGFIEALKRFGLEAEYKPINDVQVGGRKISGSAQIRQWEVVLLHGTLIVDPDYDLMYKVLRSPKRSRGSMTSLCEELGRVPEMPEVKEAVVQGFASTFDTDIERSGLSAEEFALIGNLTRTKYGEPGHTYLR